MNDIKIETSLLKSIMCGKLFGVGLVIFYGVGLYLHYFTPDIFDFIITVFFIIVFVGPFLDEGINIAIQKRKFYIVKDNTITIGSTSLLGTTQETYPLTQSSSMQIRFKKIACFESIELYLFSEKILIEKSELRNIDYDSIKSVLLETVKNRQ